MVKGLEGKQYEELLNHKLTKYLLCEGTGFLGVIVVPEKSCVHMSLGNLLESRTT